MRDRESWQGDLVEELTRLLSAELQPAKTAGRLCDVELGLFLMERMVPDQPALAGWVLFGGYPFAAAGGYVKSAEDERALRIARHLLWPLRRRRSWEQALNAYRELPVEVRGYAVGADLGIPQRRQPSIATERWTSYAKALADAPPHLTRNLPLAAPGSWRFLEGQTWTSVELPSELALGNADPHPLAAGPRGGGTPFEVTWEQLSKTAAWMETQLRTDEMPNGGNWVERLDRCELSIRELDGFVPTKKLTIDKVLHLIGMVGAGKSTLRDILAVWAARNDRRVTLVVGDVAEILRVVTMFTELGLRAAPVLGATTREQHLQRLHRRLSAEETSVLTHDAPGFDYLSTACPLDALRGVETATPLPYTAAPCTQLYPVKRAPRRTLTLLEPDPATTTPNTRQRHGCPLWQQCPRHHASRELVDADIWVATPAGLIHSAVPAHQNTERIRFLEVACRRSDLIVVDEADRVQMQLDTMFAPASVLTGRTPNSWLDEIHRHKIEELASNGRRQLSDATVMQWTAALHTVTVAADRIYHMLLRNKGLRDWVEADYFSSWTLQYKLISSWFDDGKQHVDAADAPHPAGPEWDDDIGRLLDNDAEEEPAGASVDHSPGSREAITRILDEFRDDPLGDRDHTDPQVDGLIRLTSRLLHTTRPQRTRRMVKQELAELTDGIELTASQLSQQTLFFEFTLLLSALHTRLDLLTEMWPRIEAALNFSASSNVLSRRPPEDYRPLVPESPMGNILGFQFLSENTGDPDLRSGELRFFRCAGNGRELLLQLPDLTAADGHAAPNVLLMSGTSWAGTSTRYHVLAEVGAILKPPPAELAAVERSVFTTCFLESHNVPLKLSGTKPHLRPVVLEQMLDKLARRDADGAPSRFEQELAAIDDPRRRRLLVLTGSYDEAGRATEILDRIPRWKGKVCRLVSDDAELEHHWRSSDSDDSTVRSLPRGEVANFASTGTEILVAPLLAIERGHNVLDAGVAAIGSAFFLARPHPRPDDIGLAIQAINNWASRLQRSKQFHDLVNSEDSLDAAGSAFRTQARAKWRRLLNSPIAWSRLDDDERTSFTWDQIVVIWQVVGRLVRGGVPARVVFVDAPFATRMAAGGDEQPPDTWKSSLLVAMRYVLDPYFQPDGVLPGSGEAIPALDRNLVATLYSPLHKALSQLVPNN